MTRPWLRSWLAEAWRFSLHGLTGLLAVLAHYSLMAILLNMGIAALLATTIGFSAGAVTRFVLAYWHVFEPTNGPRVAIGRFVVTIAAQAAVNAGLLVLLLAFGVSTWPAQVAATVLLTFATYAAYRLWVFS